MEKCPVYDAATWNAMTPEERDGAIRALAEEGMRAVAAKEASAALTKAQTDYEYGATYMQALLHPTAENAALLRQDHLEEEHRRDHRAKQDQLDYEKGADAMRALLKKAGR